jgi:hypothetical protein
MNEVEKQQFQDYAGRVISYMEENGRNTYPMKKVDLFLVLSSIFENIDLGL